MRRAILLTLLPLAACQTSMSTRPMPAEPKTALIGVPYAIPALRYDLTIVRTLTDCERVEPSARAASAEQQSALNVEFETEATSKASQVTGERFVVDYRALSSWSKSTAFEMALNENQTLKSFNAEAEDQGPEIASSLLKTGFTIAKMVAGLPAVAAAPGKELVTDPAKPKPKATCPLAVKQVADLSDGLEAQTKTLKEKSAELDGLIVAQFVGTLTDDEKARAAALRMETKVLLKSTSEMQKKIAGWKKDLSFTETATIDPRFGTSPASIKFPSHNATVGAQQTKWLKSMFGAEVDKATLSYIEARLGLIVPTVTIAPGATVACDNLGLTNCAPGGAPNWSQVSGDPYRPYVATATVPAGAPGVIVRMPVQTTLRVCQELLETPANLLQTPAVPRDEKTVRAACEAGDPSVTILVADSAAAAQLGPQLVLPLTNGFGQNNKLKATFRADGSLETVAYGGKGIGARLASLIGTSVEEAASYQAAAQDQRKAEEDAKASAATDALDDQIAVAKKKKELADALAALDPAPGAATKQAQIELDATVARLEAEKKIKELEMALKP